MEFIRLDEMLAEFDPYKETSLTIPEIRNRIINAKTYDVRENDSCAWVEYYISPKMPVNFMCEKCGYATDKAHAREYCGQCGRKMIGFRYPKHIKNTIEDIENEEDKYV